jgi:hypothetical protein
MHAIYQESEPWMVADFTLDMCLSCLIIAYAVYVRYHLRIRLNLITRAKWWVALVAILMRAMLMTVEFIRSTFKMTAFKYYFVFFIDQAHFMIILMLFFTVFGSWRIVTSFDPNSKMPQ